MIDFHCHLDLYPNPHEVVAACSNRNLYILSVTTTPSAWTGTEALACGSSRIWTALGLHPQIAHERISELPLFEKLLPETRYVGEIGLDGAPEFKQHLPDQTIVFTRILAACEKAGGRILSIHSRWAATQVLDALEAHPAAGTPVLHWFSGNRRELGRAIELGCWFSVNLSMLNGKNGRELAKKMPRDRVLTESDGPFAYMDGRAALPWDTDRSATALVEIWGESEDVVNNLLFSNLLRLQKGKPCSPSLSRGYHC